MRVHRLRVDGVSHHVGRWQARVVKGYHARRDINPHEIRQPKALMPVFSARARGMAIDAVERLNGRVLGLQRNMGEQCVEALLRSEGNESEDLKCAPPVSGQGTSTPCNCAEIEFVFIAGGAPGACVRLQLENSEMPRERPRMGSRRGGTRGRAFTQRQDHNSPSSSIEVTSMPQRYQGSNEEDGGYDSRSPRSEEGQMELPTLRYRLPCPQADSTLVVSITIEPGISQNTEAEPLPDGKRSSREESPIACLPVGVGTSCLAPGRELGSDLASPATNCVYAAGPSALAGPSRPAQEGSPDAVIQLSDSEDSLRFGCRVEEAPQTTDDE